MVGNVANAKVKLNFDGVTSDKRLQVPVAHPDCIIDLDTCPTSGPSYTNTQRSDSDFVDETQDKTSSDSERSVQYLKRPVTRNSVLHVLGSIFEDKRETVASKADGNAEACSVNLQRDKRFNFNIQKSHIGLGNRKKKAFEKIQFDVLPEKQTPEKPPIKKSKHCSIADQITHNYLSDSDADSVDGSKYNSKHYIRKSYKHFNTLVDQDSDEVVTQVESLDLLDDSPTNSILDIDDIEDNSRTVSDMIMDAMADDNTEEPNHDTEKEEVESLIDPSLKEIVSPESDSSDDWDILKNTLTQTAKWHDTSSYVAGNQNHLSHKMTGSNKSIAMKVTGSQDDKSNPAAGSTRTNMGANCDTDSRDSFKGFFALKREEKMNNELRKVPKVDKTSKSNGEDAGNRKSVLGRSTGEKTGLRKPTVNENGRLNREKEINENHRSLKRKLKESEVCAFKTKLQEKKNQFVIIDTNTDSNSEEEAQSHGDVDVLFHDISTNNKVRLKHELKTTAVKKIKTVLETTPVKPKRTKTPVKLSKNISKQNGKQDLKQKGIKKSTKTETNNLTSVMSFFKPVVKKEEESVETLSIKTESSNISSDESEEKNDFPQSRKCCMNCGISTTAVHCSCSSRSNVSPVAKKRFTTSVTAKIDGKNCGVHTESDVTVVTKSVTAGGGHLTSSGNASNVVPKIPVQSGQRSIDRNNNSECSPCSQDIRNITPKFNIENVHSLVPDETADNLALAGGFLLDDEMDNDPNDSPDGDTISSEPTHTISNSVHVLTDGEALSFMKTVQENVSVIKKSATDILMASSRLMFSKKTNQGLVKSSSDHALSQSDTCIRPGIKKSATVTNSLMGNQSHLTKSQVVKERNVCDSERTAGTSSWSQSNGQNRKRACPFYKKIPGTCFTVDAFRYGDVPDCQAYILSHYHYDHYMGLTKQFSNPIYCSQITANLVKSKLRVDPRYIHPLPLDTTTILHDVQITFLEANHCPGSVLILFKLKTGKVYLHTGDFRASEAMELYPPLQNLKLHALYLDTTYCDPQHAFPPQDTVIKFGVKLVMDTLACNPKTLIVCGSYTIGKERIFTAIAEALSCKICVTRDKKSVLDCLENDRLRQQTSLRWDDSQVHVLPMNKLNLKGLQEHLLQNGKMYNSVLGIEPTGWTFSKKLVSLEHIKPKLCRDNITVYGIPYSEHSSYLEMKRFVQFTKPDKILPTVNNGNVHSRRKMEVIFESWMDEGKSGRVNTAQQSSVADWMK